MKLQCSPPDADSRSPCPCLLCRHAWLWSASMVIMRVSCKSNTSMMSQFLVFSRHAGRGGMYRESSGLEHVNSLTGRSPTRYYILSTRIPGSGLKSGAFPSTISVRRRPVRACYFSDMKASQCSVSQQREAGVVQRATQ